MLRAIISIFFLFSTIGLSNSTPTLTSTVAERGVLDVTGLTWKDSDSLNLKGQWRFYWQKLVTVDDLRNNNLGEPDSYPNSLLWNRHKNLGLTVPLLTLPLL